MGMKAVLVIDIPNEYADRYNVNQMYVWSLKVQDKQGYQMFDLTTDKPNHLKPLPKPITEYDVKVSYDYDPYYAEGWNDCLDEIIGETE